MSPRAGSHLVAVLKRVKRGGLVRSFIQEWATPSARGTAASVGRSLLAAGIGFVCESCGDAFFGPPNNFRSSGTGCAARCTPCARKIYVQRRAKP